MTRDEILNTLADLMTADQLAKAITHDAFDAFVEVMTTGHFDPLFAPLTIPSAWNCFREGWESR